MQLVEFYGAQSFTGQVILIDIMKHGIVNNFAKRHRISQREIWKENLCQRLLTCVIYQAMFLPGNYFLNSWVLQGVGGHFLRGD